MTSKSLTQALFSSLAGKTIQESRMSERGVVVLSFKSGDKMTFELNNQQTVDYQSRKSKITKTEKLVQHGLKALEQKPKAVKPKRKRTPKEKVKTNE